MCVGGVQLVCNRLIDSNFQGYKRSIMLSMVLTSIYHLFWIKSTYQCYRMMILAVVKAFVRDISKNRLVGGGIRFSLENISN